MDKDKKRVRVLYSFPHKLGADRICYAAWQQVNGLASAGAEILVYSGSVVRPTPEGVRVRTTLAKGGMRIPYGLVGRWRALALHDYIVSRKVQSLADKIDIIHAWPQGARRTLKVAAKLGIPTVLERPNAHTRFAYEVVQKECDRIGVSLPTGYEHSYNEEILKKEEEEFGLTDFLLCPSDFTAKTFLDQGFRPEKLLRHIYGFDEKTYSPAAERSTIGRGLKVLFAGVCAVRKGLHYALEAWLKSPAHRDGTFMIAGSFLRAYQEKLSPMLAHPSVKVLGHRNDVPELMRSSDILVLPSIEEGFGLVCVEAMGSGCVPLVSDACTDVCRHLENSLVHPVGDTQALSGHLTLLHQDRALLENLRDGCLTTAATVTWTAAGKRLLDVYQQAIAEYPGSVLRQAASRTLSNCSVIPTQ